jgi:hypothetical protein
MRTLAFKLLLIGAEQMLNCNPQGAKDVAAIFKPPSTASLASVDVADCEYGTELTNLAGVVSCDGQAGWAASDHYDVHCFSFAAWRRDGQPLVKRKLTILRPVASDGDWFSEYPEGTIHRIRVLLSADESRAVFAELIERNVADVDLLAVATELKKPVTVKTDRFGELTLNRRINWFEGRAMWNGESVDISLEVDDDLDITSVLKTAGALFDNSKQWGKEISDFAVQEKLELANDWQDDDVEPITAADFLRRMKLESISIKTDGRFEFWHDDGDMFYGHSIRISGSLKEGLVDSDIPG